MADSSNRYRTHPFQGCNTSSSLVSVTIPFRLKAGRLFLAQVMGARFSQRKSYAFVAQMVERRSEEPGVASSILAGGIEILPFRLMAGQRSLKPRMEVRFFQRKL